MFEWVGKLIGNSTDVVNKLVQDKDLAQKLTSELQQTILGVEAAITKSQNEVNAKEAENPHLFVAGWRPFVGWICGSGLAYQLILLPLLCWAADLVGAFQGMLIPHPPPLDGNTLMTLLTGMLGLGGYRTFEKLKGVDTLKIIGKR